MRPHPHEIIHESGTRDGKGVTVIITLYNYEKTITEAIKSVERQTYRDLSLIIVEDKGTDNSLQVCRQYLEKVCGRFRYCLLVQHKENRGLSASRNTACCLADTEYIFILDADNILYEKCIEQCVKYINLQNHAMAYPIIEKFGMDPGLMSYELWNKDLLAMGNYIDAMALIRKSAWEKVGGYSEELTSGWEDYDLWCKFVEHDMTGVQVPIILARYRVHGESMLRTITNKRRNIFKLLKVMHNRHPWLRL